MIFYYGFTTRNGGRCDEVSFIPGSKIKIVKGRFKMRCKFAVVKKTMVATIFLLFMHTELFNQEMVSNNSDSTMAMDSAKVVDSTKTTHLPGTLLNFGKGINSSFNEYTADNKTEEGRQQNRRVQFVEVIPLTSK